MLKSAILGLVLAIFWLFLVLSGIWGSYLWKDGNNMIRNGLGLWLGLSIVIVFSAISFYIFNFSSLYILLIFLIITLISWGVIKKRKAQVVFNINLLEPTDFIIKYIWGYILLFIFALGTLLVSQSGEAILSPWLVVPKIFFIIYFLITVLVIKILLKEKYLTDNSIRVNLILIFSYFFLSLIVATIVYKIGYGFDPFVHRAAEFKLLELGYILPKPLYYFGQYSLVVFLSKIFWLPINIIDKFLVPVLGSIFMPLAIYYAFKNILKDKKILMVSLLGILFIVTPLFFYTVPQSLANLFLLILIFIVYGDLTINRKQSLWYWIVVVAIFLIHPLSGIPAFIILLFYYLKNKKKVYQKLGYVFSSVLIPLFFIAASKFTSFKIEFSITNLKNIKEILVNNFSYVPFYSIYHLIYLYEYNWLILFILVCGFGIYFLIKNNQNKFIINNIKLLIIFIINFILLSLIKFNSVINYEQIEFLRRFGQIIILVVSPIFLVGLYYLLIQLMNFKGRQWILLVSMAGLLTVSLYLSYPHNDAFTKARGYSVSEYDISAVRWIFKNTKNKEYIVLANQSTSAASLQEFGFYKYYNNLFYYPIPTSGKLYEIYLDMVYKGPSLEFINEARRITGVDQVYFIVNSYWLDAPKIIEQAQKLSSEMKNVNGHIWIFSFN